MRGHNMRSHKMAVSRPPSRPSSVKPSEKKAYSSLAERRTVNSVNLSDNKNVQRSRDSSIHSNAPKCKMQQAWTAAYEPSAASALTNDEINRAKAIFFQADQDGSGSIDRNELGQLLRIHLGINQTDEELDRMVATADCDGDGKLQLREWIQFFAQALQESRRDVTYDDVIDAYRAMRTYGMHGSPIEYLTSQGNSSSSATTDAMSDFMRNEFDLAINVNEVFNLPTSSTDVPFSEFQQMMLNTKAFA